METYFSPHGEPHPCRHCHHFSRLEPASGAAWCLRGGRASRMSQPDMGCAFWEHEPGADDDTPSTNEKNAAIA